MLNIHDLKAAYEGAIGQPTSDSTVYNVLTGHGWRKLMPPRLAAARRAFLTELGKSVAMSRGPLLCAQRLGRAPVIVGDAWHPARPNLGGLQHTGCREGYSIDQTHYAPSGFLDTAGHSAQLLHGNLRPPMEQIL